MSLRKAAEMALDFVEWFCGGDHSVKPKNNSLKTKEALRQALAQPEQEPVAWMFKHKETGNLTFFDSKATAYWFAKDNDRWESTPLYTAPPKREWVGLTEEEFFDLLSFDGRLDHVETPLIADFIRTIQAKLKEKNGG